MTRLVIGAPVIGQEGANQRASATFSGAEFPLAVAVVNRMTITLSLPEAGLRLGPLASGVATFHHFDRLQRVVSSLEQIARLNNAPVLVEIGSIDAMEQVPTQAPTEGGSNGSRGDEAVTIVQDNEEAFIVEFQGVRFEPLRNQVREDGTLTAGGRKAFEDARAAAETEE